MPDSKVDLKLDSKSESKRRLNELSQAEQLEQAVELLKAGELVAFPTETVYGLGADASNPDAVIKIFEAKGRPADHPVIVHLHSSEAIQDWAKDIPEDAWVLANAFWPGPLTLILKKQAHVLDCVTGGQDSVGLRVPSHPLAQELLKAFEGGLVAPSANLFGHISPTSADHVKADFGDAIPLILDGGECDVGLESTIVDLTGLNPRVLRPGGISVDALKAVMPTLEVVAKKVQSVADADSRSATSSDVEVENSEQVNVTGSNDSQSSELRVSGLLDKHYAPKVKTYLIDDLPEALKSLQEVSKRSSLSEERDVTKHIGVIACNTQQAVIDDALINIASTTEIKTWLQLANSPEAYAQQLYSSMRDLEECVDEIWIEAVPQNKAWLAVSDRLARATITFKL